MTLANNRYSISFPASTQTARPRTTAWAAKRLLPAAGCILIAICASAANWPQWRGPNGDGISAETNVPVKWSATENVAWKSPLPGNGHSSPTVWEDSVFLTTALKDSSERQLLRL